MAGDKCIQVNLNNSRPALDALFKYMMENRAGLACVSEPPMNSVSSAGWFHSRHNLAAIYWLPWHFKRAGVLSHTGRDFVVVKFGQVYVVSVYVSPSERLNYFLDFLEELRDYYLSIRGSVMLIGGDFNARSSFWGDSACNKRGEVLEEWAAGLDFCLCNEGTRFTCVRPQGSSIVDTTWISANGVGRLDS